MFNSLGTWCGQQCCIPSARRTSMNNANIIPRLFILAERSTCSKQRKKNWRINWTMCVCSGIRYLSSHSWTRIDDKHVDKLMPSGSKCVNCCIYCGFVVCWQRAHIDHRKSRPSIIQTASSLAVSHIHQCPARYLFFTEKKNNNKKTNFQSTSLLSDSTAVEWCEIRAADQRFNIECVWCARTSHRSIVYFTLAVHTFAPHRTRQNGIYLI